MNYYSKPSFSSTLLHHMKSLFECFMSQDVQLIDFDNYKVPYLLNHNYDETDYQTDYQTDESSESSEIPLLEVKRVKRVRDGKTGRKILIENGPMAGDNGMIVKKERQSTAKNSNQNLNQNSNQVKSSVLKLGQQGTQKGYRKEYQKGYKQEYPPNNQLFTSLSDKFKSWSIQTKEKYVDGLVRTARMYIQLKDFDRAESVLFEALDFYLDKFVKIKKAIETLSLLDSIYSAMSRYLEQIEVNKLIINIAAPDDEQVRRSIEKVMNAYRRMGREDKAQKFIEEFNKKRNKK